MRQYLLTSLGCLIFASTCAAQNAWTLIKPNTSPSARQLHAMAYDPARKRTVLFGGWNGNDYLADTWDWDGNNWLQLQPTASPPKRNSHVMAFDNIRKRMVLFGGWNGKAYLNDTWELDTKTWTQVQTTSTPPGLLETAMVYDEARQRTVVFGGRTVSGPVADTWEWDGKDWTKSQPKASPLARSRHAMAYDSARRRTVLFGGLSGEGYMADTWEWDGTNWKEIQPSAAPGKRAQHALAYDARRQRMVLFGGWDGLGYLADTWEFDGNDWVQVRNVTSPTGRERHRMVFDSDRARAVLFGGTLGSLYYKETWEYDGPRLALMADTSLLAITGGSQKFVLDADTQHGGRNYWIFGSLSGTNPGIDLGPMHFPLNPDAWTDITIAQANTSVLTNTRGVLDSSGKAEAAFNIPAIPDPRVIGLVFHHAYLVYDTQSNFHLVSNPVSLLLTAPQDRIIEVFTTDKYLDKPASSGNWGSNKLNFGNIGGDGVLGDFNHTNGKNLGGNVFEWSTDGGTTIPAAQCLDNAPHTITDGVFNFQSFVVPAGVTVHFVGKNPVQINVWGDIDIQGNVLLNGVDLKKDAHKGQASSGEQGSIAGAGGGRGGKGGDPGDGNSNKSNFNGQDGEDCQLPSGHAYSANVATTGGPGSAQYPADGKKASIKYTLFDVISVMATPGGSGGGNLLAGQAGSAIWKDSQGKPNATYNKEIGPAPKAGTALGWDPVKPTTARSLEHHQVGGAGGGGGGSHPLGAISSGSLFYRAGRGGGGGGGAIAIRSGRHLAMASGSTLQAKGGSASPNLSSPFSDNDPCPGGGGAGGTIFFQVDGTTDMKGTLDVSGGKGGQLIDSPTFSDTITNLGGDGGAGVIRMETVGTLDKTRLGTTVPAAKDTDVQKLTDQDRFVGVRSLWYEVNITNPPKFVRYEIHAKVDGQDVTYSDDTNIGSLATKGSTPLVFVVQGAQLKKDFNGEVEPIPNTIKPWRRYVGPFVTGQSLSGDGAHGFRFALLLDRSFSKPVEVQHVTVIYTLE